MAGASPSSGLVRVRKQRKNNVPGPGEYDSDVSPVKRRAQTVLFSQTRREEVFETKEAVNQPGPGGYEQQETWNNPSIYTTIKGKYNIKPESKPGPGEYEQDASKNLRANSASVRIGTAPRKDIWEDQVKASVAQPGPGGYIENTSTLNTKGATIGLPKEERYNANPGPGQYENDASKNLRSNQASVRIGTAPRKDIWED